MDAIARLPKTKAPSRRAARKGIDRPADRPTLEMLAAQAATAARMLKLLGNKNRLFVLCALIMRDAIKAGDLVKETGLSQSALSQHLALLPRRRPHRLPPRISDLVLSRRRPAPGADPQSAQRPVLR